jgi:hypothetical protein
VRGRKKKERKKEERKKGRKDRIGERLREEDERRG